MQAKFFGRGQVIQCVLSDPDKAELRRWATEQMVGKVNSGLLEVMVQDAANKSDTLPEAQTYLGPQLKKFETKKALKSPKDEKAKHNVPKFSMMPQNQKSLEGQLKMKAQYEGLGVAATDSKVASMIEVIKYNAQSMKDVPTLMNDYPSLLLASYDDTAVEQLDTSPPFQAAGGNVVTARANNQINIIFTGDSQSHKANTPARPDKPTTRYANDAEWAEDLARTLNQIFMGNNYAFPPNFGGMQLQYATAAQRNGDKLAPSNSNGATQNQSWNAVSIVGTYSNNTVTVSHFSPMA